MLTLERTTGAAGTRWITSPLPRRQASRWTNLLIPAAILGVIIPLAVAEVTGNLAIPHNDAFSYSLSAQIFASTWKIHLIGWANMTLIGQLVMLGPLGRWITVQQSFVAVLAAVVLYCVYTLVSGALDTRRAAFATVLTAIWPGFGLLATSFMTDIPALAGTFGALVVGRYALKRDSRRMFYLSLVIAFWAASVREQALAAPLVLIGYGMLTSGQRTRLKTQQLIGGGLIFVILLVPLVLWRSSLPNADNPHMVLQLGPYWRQLRTLTPIVYFTLAYGISPAVVLTVRPHRWRWSSWIAAAIAAGIAIAILETGGGLLDGSTGNYLQPSGPYSAVMGGTREVFGGSLPHVFNYLAAVSGVMLAGTLAERWRRADPILAWFTLITAVVTAVIASGGLGLFDRYLLALAPGTLAIVLTTPGRETTDARKRLDHFSGLVTAPVAAATFLFVTVISALIIANGFSFDIASWHAGQAIVKRTGLPADKVNAGLDWIGSQGLYGLPATCVVLSNSPVSTPYTSVRSYSYRTFLLSGDSELYEYNTHAPGCPKSLSA